MLKRLGQRRLRDADCGVSLQGQPTFLSLLGKALVIAICAAVTPALTLAVVSAVLENGGAMSLQATYSLFAVSLLGSFMIGFPVAMLVYFMAWRHLVRFPTTLVLITFLSVVVMTIASFVIGGAGGIAFLGLPAAFAAVTYAGLGYLWIIRPMRTATMEAEHA